MKNSLFTPKSIAIVGASTDPEKIASVLLKNLIQGGYKGGVYPINPKYKKVQGKECFPDILSVKGNVDTVCIAIPYQFVEPIIDQCVTKRVRTVVIITAGFKETGEEGKILEERIAKKLKGAHIRLLGPNCLGYINNKANINLSFARKNPGDGDIAFVSQSGAFCTAILDMAVESKIGFSHIISLGNKADIYENELMEQLLFDKKIKALALYLEEFSDGKEFVTLAQKAKKPILLIAPGSSEKAKQAISSHTGSLASSYDTIVAAVKKSNVILTENSEDLFKLIVLINENAIPKGSNIAIVTNAGGPGIIATDAVEREGLTLMDIAEDIKGKLLKALPRESNIKDPIDILGDAKADRYELAIKAVLQEEDVDSIFVILTPQLITDIEGTAKKIVDIQRTTSKPIYACFLGGKDVKAGIKVLEENRIPIFNDIQEGIHLISKLVKFEEGKEKTKLVSSNQYNVRTRHRKEILSISSDTEVHILPDELTMQLLKEFKVDIPNECITASLDEATDFAALNFPVAIKATSEDLAHKTDFKAVYLDIRTISEFEEKFEELKENITKITGNPSPEILIQEMIEGNIEFFVGTNREGNSKIYERNGRGFGHLLAIGQGGIYTEVFKDIRHILLPECQEKIEEIFDETKVSTIINGYRGKPALAKEKLLDLIMKIQKLLISYPEIVSMDINPVMITKDRAVAVDVKIYVKN
jgi:acetyltransferase